MGTFWKIFIFIFRESEIMVPFFMQVERSHIIGKSIANNSGSVWDHHKPKKKTKYLKNAKQVQLVRKLPWVRGFVSAAPIQPHSHATQPQSHIATWPHSYITTEPESHKASYPRSHRVLSACQTRSQREGGLRPPQFRRF